MTDRSRDTGHESRPLAYNRMLLQTAWAAELAALRLAVSAMREELNRALDRERRARHLAYHDDLTALPNRRYFHERLAFSLQCSIRESLDLAVIYLDLDGFKTLNDVHGHDAGDHLLRIVAARLQHAVRAGDFVSRLGGDEYACLISGVTARERMQEIALSLFKAVATPFQVGESVITVKPSIGIALYPADGATTDALMRSADAAMYAAKHTRSGISFAESARFPPLSRCHALSPDAGG